jgi:hypothetical protein
LRTGLAGAQVALSMLLLVTAGLFARSLANLGRADLGLPVERTITFALSPERSGYAPARTRELFARVTDELAAVPGVTGVAAAQVPMLANDNSGDDVAVEGYQIGPDENTQVNFNRVSAGYFRALGVPLLAGREFADADRVGAPKVAVVNGAFARRFRLGPNPVGRRMSTVVGGPLDIQIVGLVRDAAYSAVRDTVPPVFFTPLGQRDDVGAATFYVRTALAPEPLLGAARAVVGRARPGAAGGAASHAAAAGAREHLPRPPARHAGRGVSPSSPPCSRPWGSTGCSPTPSPSARTSSGCAWRSAPAPGACVRSSSVRSGASCSWAAGRASWPRSGSGGRRGRSCSASRATTRRRSSSRARCSRRWGWRRATCPPGARRASSPRGHSATSDRRWATADGLSGGPSPALASRFRTDR